MKVLYSSEKIIIIERERHANFGILQVLEENDSEFVLAEKEELIPYLKKIGFNDVAKMFENDEISIDGNFANKIANMKVYDYMKTKGIGDFEEGTQEGDIEFFEWYMQEAENLHKIVNALGVESAADLADLIRKLQTKQGLNTDWYDNL